jgi:hypothetical protein
VGNPVLITVLNGAFGSLKRLCGADGTKTAEIRFNEADLFPLVMLSLLHRRGACRSWTAPIRCRIPAHQQPQVSRSGTLSKPLNICGFPNLGFVGTFTNCRIAVTDGYSALILTT